MAAKPSLSDRLMARLHELSDAELDAIAKHSLDLKAERGDAAARHCAAVLAGQRLGAAAPIDDAALLAEVDALALTGRGPAAVGIVARRHAETPDAIHTLERRLRRKRAGKQKKRTTGSAAPGDRLEETNGTTQCT